MGRKLPHVITSHALPTHAFEKPSEPHDDPDVCSLLSPNALSLTFGLGAPPVPIFFARHGASQTRPSSYFSERQTEAYSPLILQSSPAIILSPPPFRSFSESNSLTVPSSRFGSLI